MQSNHAGLQNTIARIQYMEECLDAVLAAMETDPSVALEDTFIQGKICELQNYYESGQWLQDYDCDTQGELPTDMKRGVLSQDTLYDLLCEISQRR